MDKFVSANRYTVKMGIYQPQMNLQDPNHKQRYRAMIVGFDERDKANASTLRPLPNSPFVLLDGKQKQLAFECNIQNGYYKLIVKFDDEHKKFCEWFLQAFNVLKPGNEIFELYEIFTALINKPSLPDTRTLANVLDKFNNYKPADKSKDPSVIKASPVYEVYKRVNVDVSRLLQEEFSSALSIINWMLSSSEFVGDTGAKQRLTDIICKEFAKIIFSKIDNTVKRSYWAQIQRTGFKLDAARAISNINTVNNSFSPEDAATFIVIYLESCTLTGNTEQQGLQEILKHGIIICCRYNDQKSFDEIVSIFSKLKKTNNQELSFALLKLLKGTDKKNGEFVVQYIIDHDNNKLSSDKSALSFCDNLQKEGLGHLAGSVLMKRVEKLNKPSEMEQFIKTILNADFIDKETLAKVFESIDDKIGASKDNVSSIAELLQTQKPEGAKCISSAHIVALNLSSGSFKKKSPVDVFKELKKQGFPSITDEGYIDKFIESLLKINLADEEQGYIFNFIFHAPKEYNLAYLKKIVCAAPKYKDKWNALINFISDGKNKQIDDDILQILADSGQNEKSLMALGNLLKVEDGRIYYKSIADKAIEIISSQKNKPKDDRK